MEMILLAARTITGAPSYLLTVSIPLSFDIKLVYFPAFISSTTNLNTCLYSVKMASRVGRTYFMRSVYLLRQMTTSRRASINDSGSSSRSSLWPCLFFLLKMRKLSTVFALSAESLLDVPNWSKPNLALWAIALSS